MMQKLLIHALVLSVFFNVLLLVRWQRDRENLSASSYNFDIVYRSRRISVGTRVDEAVRMIGFAPAMEFDDARDGKTLVWSSTYQRGPLDLLVSPDEQKGGIFLRVIVDSQGIVTGKEIYEP